jgi:hypothetical protein
MQYLRDQEKANNIPNVYCGSRLLFSEVAPVHEDQTEMARSMVYHHKDQDRVSDQVQNPYGLPRPQGL